MNEEKAILIRYGEIWLKSEPVRHQFEQILVGNIRQLFSAGTRISVVPGRIWVHDSKAPKELSRVFGIVSFSQVIICDKNIDEIKSAAKQITEKWKSGTFAVRATRADKAFPLNSKQIEIAAADVINMSVDLANPDNLLSIEIRDRAYLYDKTTDGPAGLPLGSAGKVAAQLRDSDDLLAAWMLMKRGALPILLKPKPALLKLLQKWAVGRKLKTAKSLNEIRAAALIDFRSKKAKEKNLIILNPLAGFSDDEKAKLLNKIKE